MTLFSKRNLLCSASIAALSLALGCPSSRTSVDPAGDSARDSGKNEGGCSCQIEFNGVSDTLECGVNRCVNGEQFECAVGARVNDLGHCDDAGTTDAGAKDAGTKDAGTADAGTVDGGNTSPPDGGVPVQADWTRNDLGITTDLTDTALNVDNSRLYLVGASGLCWVTSPTGFALCGLPPVSSRLNVVRALLDDDAVVAAEDGSVFYRSFMPGLPLTWKKLLNGPTVAVRALAWPTPGRVYLFGDSGLARVMDIYSSPATATPLDGVPPNVSLHGASATESLDKNHLWAVGTGGTIARLDDVESGHTLVLETSGTTATLNAVLAQDEAGDLKAVTAVGNGGLILVRSAAGVWSQQASGISTDLYAIFQGLNGIFATGAHGVVLARNEGETLWIPMKSGVDQTLRAGALRVTVSTVNTFIAGDTGTFLFR